MLLFVLFVAMAPPSPKQQLERGEKAYADYHYSQAIGLLQNLLADPALTDGPTRQEARLTLAFSFYLSGRESDARDQLRKLFRENASYPLDRDATHPDLVRFYDSERNAYVASLKTTPAALSVAAEPLRTLGDRQPWLRIFPLGIGQFANHDFVAGGIFCGLELALVGTNIVAAVARNGLRQGSTFRLGSNPVPLQIVMDVAGVAAIVVTVIGIVDAFAWSPSRGRKTLTAAVLTVGDYRLVLQ